MQTTNSQNNLGFEQISEPVERCESRKCPFHGSLSVYRRLRQGQLVSTAMQGSGVVSHSRLIYVPKYKRYKRTTYRLSVHLPACLGAKKNDTVVYAECRPLAKTIAHVVIGVVKK